MSGYILNGKNLKENKSIRKILGLIACCFIVGLLIFSAPAQAFVLNLTMDKTSVTGGDFVNFESSVDINSNENLPISKLVLELDGSEKVSCEFNTDGVIIRGCKGITIEKSTASSSGNYGYGYGYGYSTQSYYFGYGYGYTYGKLVYKIKLDTSSYNTGNYNTKLYAYIGNEVFSKSGQILTINEKSTIVLHDNQDSSPKKSACVNAWTCSAWGECDIWGTQTRTCNLVPNCFISTEKPEESRSCVVGSENNNELGVYSFDSIKRSESNTEEPDSESDNTALGRFSFAGITGAVIGAVNGGNWPALIIGLVIIIVVLLGLIVGIFLLKFVIRSRRNGKQQELERIMYKPQF